MVTGYHAPGGPGVRVDSAIYDGYSIPPYYDSLVSKVIVVAETRQEAIDKMLVALNECIIGGITTNMDLHKKILKEKRFIEGQIHTKLIEELLSNEAN